LDFSDVRRENNDGLLAQAARFEHGEGVGRDYSMALALYCIAAKRGQAQALYSLGWMYANARGVSRDNGVAWQLFKLAAEQGHEQAQRMLPHLPASPSSELPACLLPDPASPEEESLEPGGGTHVFPQGPIFELVTRLAPRYGIDPRLALAVISVESGFNIKAISPRNAQGLMQLMPETAQRFRVKNTFDPEENIKGGLAYLRWLLAYFQGNVPLVAAAYNAGERAVEAYRGIPPYAETREYVRKIMKLYTKALHPYQPHVVDASSAILRVTAERK
jgi:soluble lytic murein transglycosylase-like protein